MPFDFAPLSQRQLLQSRQTLLLDDAEGTVITVESGSLWLTMENDKRDIVLLPGMRFEVDRSGRTIVAAEEDTRFRLLAARDCDAGSAARIVQKITAAFDRWAQRKASRFAPYY